MIIFHPLIKWYKLRLTSPLLKMWLLHSLLILTRLSTCNKTSDLMLRRLRWKGVLLQRTFWDPSVRIFLDRSLFSTTPVHVSTLGRNATCCEDIPRFLTAMQNLSMAEFSTDVVSSPTSDGALKANDMEHILRRNLANLIGAEDYNGCPVIVVPNRVAKQEFASQQQNSFLQTLLYFYSISKYSFIQPLFMSASAK